MTQHSAHISRAVITKGAAILICGEAKAGDTLAIATPNNSRLAGEVVTIASDGAQITIAGSPVILGPWTPNDDPLPNWSEPSSRWTVR
jgi:hypothetical protein